MTTLECRARHRALGTAKAYDTPDLVAGARAVSTKSHVDPSIHAARSISTIDGQTTQHPVFAISHVKRNPVGEGLG